jgi:hypothetical protein
VIRKKQPVDELFLTILSRPPTAAEREAVSAHLRAQSGGPRRAALDVAWALINSAEFLLQH